MLSRDYTDIVGGAVLIAVGLGFSGYAYTHYDMGTINRMGPGMFPAAMGLILAAFGLMQAIPAFFRAGPIPEIRIWSPIFVLASIGAFAAMIRPFGLLPSIAVLILISSCAELKLRPVSLLILTGTMCVMSWLIFRVGLGVPLAMARWPF
ncbi:tripartite tricarboxylate transporter TctB family protein [uncultured Paracoccus sp.]|uniref:tripartite tricarboxylate transporter TctB family protein n=1 Tax=uncultured Paracoccus sp. TaxID=189685 RepID=UPI0025FEA55A|nr:tripartite tricarboxylate transporter TctB family protein [uncultured Paracoccus sp.]